MDDDLPSTGSPLLDLIAARRAERASAGPVVASGNGTGPRWVLTDEPGPEPEPAADPGPPEGPLAVAARLRRERSEAGVKAGVVVAADGAPGRLHALHRRKTRGVESA